MRESIYPEDCDEKIKSEINKMLKLILHSKGKKNVKKDDNIDSIGSSLGGKYTFFMICFDTNKNGTVHFEYKLITGELDIEKAHSYELIWNEKFNEKVEEIAPEETKKIITKYIGLNEDEKLYEYLQNEKKIF